MFKSLLNNSKEWDILFRKPFKKIMEVYNDAICLNNLGFPSDWENFI